MSHDRTPSPFRDGFAALFYEPALLAAELTWRWCLGISALALTVTSVALFLDSIKLSPTDEALLRSLQPSLWMLALRHAFAGSLSRLVLELVALVVGLTLLWSFAAAAGRAAILCRLVAMFLRNDDAAPTGPRFAPIFLLQLLRAMWLLIAVSVAAGLSLYGLAMAQDGDGMRAALALSFGVGFTCFTGILLNWCLFVAPIFCIRNGVSAMESLDQTIAFLSRRSGALFLLELGFFGLRLVWAATMGFVVLSPISLLSTAHTGWIILPMAVALLAYLGGDDLLAVVRLAAYVSLAEDDSQPASVPQSATAPASDANLEMLPGAGPA